MSYKWTVILLWLSHMKLAYSRLEFDEDRLHVGVSFPFSFPGFDYDFSSALVVSTLQSILDIGKLRDPPLHPFVKNESNGTSIPPACPLRNPTPHEALFDIKYHLYDTQWSRTRASRSALDFGFGIVEGNTPPMNVVVGAALDDSTRNMANILALMDTVQVGPLSLGDELTNKRDFPYLVRTVSGQGSLGHELLDYMVHFQWRGANGLYEDTTYGLAIRTGLLDAAQAAGRVTDLFLFPWGIGFSADWETTTHIEVAKIVDSWKSEHKLIFFIVESDPWYGAEIRRALLTHGIQSPRYQYVTTYSTVIQSNKHTFENHTNWHGYQLAVRTEQASLQTYLDTWHALTPDLVTSLFNETGISNWSDPPAMVTISEEAFAADPPFFATNLNVAAGFCMIFNAFNDMLHAGQSPKDIQGPALKEAILNVSIEAYGGVYKFDVNQDTSAGGDLCYLDRSNDGFVWVPFALRTAVGELDGKIEMYPDFPDGPVWATGTHGLLPPIELRGCDPGWMFIQNQSDPDDLGSCVECPGGMYSPSYNSRSCETCLGGYFSGARSFGCGVCPEGWFALANQTECTQCFTGTVAASSGSSGCADCLVGTFQNSSGASSCMQCPPGYFQTNIRSAGCEPCVQGTYAVGWGNSACATCLAGYSQEEDGKTECHECAKGSYQENPGQSACNECRPGAYMPNATSVEPCNYCTLGTYASTNGATTCEECHYGTTFVLGAMSQSWCTCPRDTFAYFTEGSDVPECVGCNEFIEDCPGGDDPVYQKSGYQVSVDGRYVYQCVSTTACPGGIIGECPFGSSGPGCATCDGTFYWDGGACTECTGANTMFIIALPLALLALIVGTYRFGNDPIATSISSVSEFVVLCGLSLSIFFFFASFSALDVKWKEPVNTLLKLSVILSTELTNVHVSCSVSWGGAASLAFTSALPLLMGIPCTLVACLGLASTKKLFNTFATLIYAAYLLLLLHALKPFRYIVHPIGGQKSLLFMPEVFEGSTEHNQMMIVGLGVIALYCLPFATACIWAAISIKKVKHAGQRRWYLVTFRFLFYKFCPHASYWGLCILARNALFALAPSLFPEQPGMAVWTLSAVAILSGMHTALICPWRAKWMNVADVGILAYVALVLNVAVGWVRKDEDSDGILATFLAVIAMTGAFLVLVFTAKLMLMIACASKEKREQMREKIKAKEAELEKYFMEDAQVDPHQEVANALDALFNPKVEQIVQLQTSMEMSIPAALRWVSSQPFDLAAAGNIAKHIRDRDYSLQSFFEDCIQVFPELWLYSSTDGSRNTDSKAIRTRRRSQAEALSLGDQEQLRTFGALFAVYWGCRLDIDGKKGLAFGVQDDNPHKVRDGANIKKEELEGIGWGKMTADQRRANFYYNFDWSLVEDLFVAAGLTMRSPEGKISVDGSAEGRLVAMLCLTAFHDIMKNPILCPVVLKREYDGYKPGETINDHDLALAYVLDRYPDVLPSYRDLSPSQRRAVRFTQSEMGFNAGWLVQAEGPPSAVLAKLKKAIGERGVDNDEDVAFYFAHWVTDLAGAEPTPFLGTEKFAVKFPPPVLQGLLSCFSIVKYLADGTETEIYERYLVTRWKAAENLLGPLPQGPERTAKLRLHCMGQGGAKSLLDEFDRLPVATRDLLAREMAETGLVGQQFSEWQALGGPQVGMPFLTYYGPAWCQRIGQTHPNLCLQVLAMIFRLCRVAYPESKNETPADLGSGSRTAQLGALKTVDVDDLRVVIDDGDSCFEMCRDNRLECTLKVYMLSA